MRKVLERNGNLCVRNLGLKIEQSLCPLRPDRYRDVVALVTNGSRSTQRVHKEQNEKKWTGVIYPDSL